MLSSKTGWRFHTKNSAIRIQVWGIYPKALTYYEIENKLFEALYDSDSTNVEFKNGLAISYVRLAGIYLEKNDITKVKNYLKEAEKYFLELCKTFPQNTQFKQYLKIVQEALLGLDKPSPFDATKISEAEKDEIKYLKMVEAAKSNADKAEPQVQLVEVYAKLYVQYKDNAALAEVYSKSLGSLAWYQLFDRQFAVAEKSSRLGLEIDEKQEWINTNLVLALLYQGKWEEAKALYLLLKDKPYNGATYQKTFLKDLQALEDAGMKHHDVKKARALLK